MLLRNQPATMVARTRLSSSILAFNTALATFGTNYPATVAIPEVAGNIHVLNAQLTEITRLMGEINGAHHTEANIRTLRDIVRRFGELIDITAASIPDQNERINFVNTVRSQYSRGWRVQLNDLQIGGEGMKADSSHLKGRALGGAIRRRYDKVMAGVSNNAGKVAKTIGVVGLGVAGLVGGGMAVKKLAWDSQEVPTKATSLDPSHKAKENGTVDPSVKQLFARFTVGGGIENMDTQKFDNLFEALQSKQSIMGEAITLDRGQVVHHFTKGGPDDDVDVLYPTGEIDSSGIPIKKPHTIDVFLTANREGIPLVGDSEKYIVVATKATNNETEETTLEKLRFFRRVGNGFMEMSINDKKSFRPIQYSDFEKELRVVGNFFGN